MKVVIVLLSLVLLISCVSAKTKEDCKCQDSPSLLLLCIAMGIVYIIIDKNKVFHHPSRQRYGLGEFHTGENYYSEDEYSEYEGAEPDS